MESLHLRKKGSKRYLTHYNDGYTLDFYFPTLRLAIEIDGGSHNNRVGYDWERDTNLERRGIRTLRATNEQVFNNPQGLAESLFKIIQNKITEQVERENTYSASAIIEKNTEDNTKACVLILSVSGCIDERNVLTRRIQTKLKKYPVLK